MNARKAASWRNAFKTEKKGGKKEEGVRKSGAGMLRRTCAPVFQAVQQMGRRCAPSRTAVRRTDTHKERDAAGELSPDTRNVGERVLRLVAAGRFSLSGISSSKGHRKSKPLLNQFMGQRDLVFCMRIALFSHGINSSSNACKMGIRI